MTRRRGFTLIEILVVIGIMTILIGLAFPMFSKVRRSARESACRGQLQTISAAVAAYRQDFGTIPAILTAAGTTQPSGQEPALTNCLIAPGPATEDGADGAGFKTRRALVNGSLVPQGKTYGPYLDPDKFKFDGARQLLDVYGTPFSYVPDRNLRDFTLKSAGEDTKFGTGDDLQ